MNEKGQTFFRGTTSLRGMEDNTSGGCDGGEGDVIEDEVDIIGVENAEEYGPGGYHPISKGDILGGRCDIRSFKFRLIYFIQVSSEK